MPVDDSALTDDALMDITAIADSVNAAGFQLDSVNIKGTVLEAAGCPAFP